MRSYFTSDNKIYAYEDSKADQSFHEIYQTYKPTRQQCQSTLVVLRQKRAALLQLESDCRSALYGRVPSADLDFAVALVAAGAWLRDLERVDGLIALNQFCLQRTDALDVISIPVTDFLQFDRQGWCRCPFHADRHASMKLYRKDNRVHCFSGCGQKNVIQVYAQLNNITTREAFIRLKGLIA